MIPALKRERLSLYVLALGLIMVMKAFFEWIYYCGLVNADDYSYGVYSYIMFRLPLPWDLDMDFRILRFSLLLPVALLFRFLPPVELTAVLYPMALSFGTVVIVFLIGKRLYGHLAGIFAAFIMASLPVDVLIGTMLLPDTVVPFYIACSVWAFLEADASSGKKAWLWYLISGFSMFCAFNARENSYYFLLFFAPFMLSARRWKHGLAMFGVGFAVPVIALYTFFYFKTGDFLYNLHLAQAYSKPLIESGYIPKNTVNWYIFFYYMFPGFFKLKPTDVGFFNPTFGITFIAGAPCLAYVLVKSLVKRDWKLLLTPWWYVLSYMFLEFGTISFDHYQMMKKLPRFLLILTPAIALAGGIMLADIGRIGRKRNKGNEKPQKKQKTVVQEPVKIHPLIRFFPCAAITVLMSLQVFYFLMAIAVEKKGVVAGNEKFKWGYHNVLKDLPLKPLYGLGGWWYNRLSFYFLPDLRFPSLKWKQSEMLRELKDVKDSSELAGSYVIIDRTLFSGENDLKIKHLYDSFGGYIQLPPHEWKLLGSNFNTEIYEVPAGWNYTKPDGKEFVLGAFRHALTMKDVVLAVHCLHQEFLATFKRESFIQFINSVINLDSPESRRLFAERLEFREYNGEWKLVFNLN